MQRLDSASTIARIILSLALGFALELTAAAQSQGTDPTLLLPEARRLLATSDYAGAERTLREALQSTPDSASGHYLLGFVLLHEDKPAEAIAEYMQGAKLKYPGAEELLGFATAQELLLQHENAERSLTAATKLAPERALLWYQLGRTQFEQQHWADAERSFATCLKLEPHHVQAQTMLGLVFEQLDRPEAAIAAYRAAMALEDAVPQKDPQPYLAMGMLLRKQGKVADALPWLILATGSTHPDPLAHQELGLAYEHLRRFDEALGEMKTAVFLAPNLAALHFFLGRIYRETGHESEAAQEFAKAARLTSTPLVSSAAVR